jgi:predicted ArsR family transcriptional regulator
MNSTQIELGEENREAVRKFFSTHLCCTQVECAKALGLSSMAVNRHVKAIRAEWRKAKLAKRK